MVAAAPVSVSWVTMSTVAPAAAVPVTVVVPPSMVAAEAGDVIVTVVAAGAPWVT